MHGFVQKEVEWVKCSAKFSKQMYCKYFHNSPIPTQLLTHGQWWSIFKIHRLQILQWWALSGLYDWHLLQILLGGRGFGLTSNSVPSLLPLVDISKALKSGSGSASGGTEPGSVVMAKKWDADARKATKVKNTEWNFPQKVSYSWNMENKLTWVKYGRLIVKKKFDWPQAIKMYIEEILWCTPRQKRRL